MKKKLLILGCTGSIGKSAVHCLENHGDLFELAGLSAHSNEKKLLELGRRFGTKNLCLTGSGPANDDIPYRGQAGLQELIQNTDAQVVLNGIAGAAGLLPSIEAVNRGLDLALANKETIVMAGDLIKAAAAKSGSKILPVDSEHSAVFSLVERFGQECLDTVILTASGGAFKNTAAAQLPFMKAADALRHPTWNMGKKITVDSATLANKGLEVIEAARLFNLQGERVKVVLHPQSLVHSLIRTKDGVLYAQISKPDMIHPILSALTWPDCVPNSFEKLDLSAGCEMTFCAPRFIDFPMLGLAYEALKKGAAYTIAYNAANEEAVSRFLRDEIGFTHISSICKQVLDENWGCDPAGFDEVFELDVRARKCAAEYLRRL